MHRTITTDVAADPERVLEAVADLSTYPSWLDLVSTVEVAAADPGDQQMSGPHDAPSPAWFVTLRAKVGPFARSKRLRMVRTTLSSTGARFERREVDGRDHAAWTLTSSVDEGPAGAVVTMELTYDGALFSGPLGAILDAASEDAGPKLSAYAST